MNLQLVGITRYIHVCVDHLHLMGITRDIVCNLYLMGITKNGLHFMGITKNGV